MDIEQEIDPVTSVLGAYNDAYTTGLTIKTSNTPDAKYYPENPSTENIEVRFMKIGINDSEVAAIIRDAPPLQMASTAFMPQGHFTENQVRPYVTRDTNNNFIIDFKKIMEIPDPNDQEIVFQRALTMIYGKQYKDGVYFFNPYDHIQKAASLKDTVDIMIRSRNAARG